MSTVKKIIGLALFIIIVSGCKKTIQNIQEDLVLKAMTDGQWKITNFIHNGNTITSDFDSYKFKYYSDKTVDAINNGTFERKGNWDGNAAAMTTWANFAGAPNPIALINGTWNIVRNSWTYVEATQNVGGETKTMRLDKQ